ncbi:MAG TPA: zf-TFIIB domain-containing protein [Kofleriaceae bacterium]|nr:zf-TFIIB domain-containing protein [Kofleriaceae bacterium]
MKCPGCTSDMVTTDVHSIEIDRCPNCGGIVLDKGEQDTIEGLGLGAAVEGGVQQAHEHRNTTAHCYECRRDMIALKGAGDVEYDWCDGCERLFFDRGELTAIDAFVDS